MPNTSDCCYVKNGIGVCNYHERAVTISEYTCVSIAGSKSSCSPYCNCHNCVQSEFCDCGVVQCYIKGIYDDHECKMSDSHSYNGAIHNYPINTTNNYFVEKGDYNTCYEMNPIISKGKLYYKVAIFGIAIASWVGLTLFIGLSDLLINFIINKYNTSNDNTNNDLDNINIVQITDIEAKPFAIPVIVPPKSSDYVTVNKYDDNTCSICMDQIDKTQQYALLKCAHCYHEDCINFWLSKHKTCPTCVSNTKLDIV